MTGTVRRAARCALLIDERDQARDAALNALPQLGARVEAQKS
ncbi:hypothetical protein [Chondromyces apiculatus]|uniref:Uncharacterized protein n=1 Tax=Chondromyces apiculatus DSM 436 TaxID=1192034 RepID=A0A017T2V5_9BACT|nr:hypothetical protein [Chondromyces apiculatus]EYF02896.1 Hypothetical protein CAP_6476 [Chondromyces apiculatus DSM 436]